MGKYSDINFTPPDGVRSAYKQGLKLHEEGKTGSGLEAATVSMAKKLSSGQAVSPEWARKGNRFWARNERFLSKEKDSPAYASAMLWGGRPGMSWFRKLYSQMESSDKEKKGNSMRLNRIDTLHVNQSVSKRRVRGKDMIVIGGAVHAIKDSVMNGIFYPGEEIEALCNKLEGRRIPVPVSHPTTDDGAFLSANDPLALMSNYIGAYAENFSMKGDKLISDILIDPEMASMSDGGKEVLSYVDGEKDLDASTGVYFEPVINEGVAPDGESYDRVATNMDLDHTALLPYEPGAKQSNEGVGLFANSAVDREGNSIGMVTFEANASAAGQNYPVADAGTKWDGAQAEKRIREFSKSGDKPSTNYRKFFMWFDRDNPEDYGSYKLPFVDVIDGRPQVIPKALAAIKGSLSGARGETVDIPDADKKAVKALVESYENKASAASNSKLGIIERATNALKDALASLNGYNTGSGVDAAFNKSDEDQRMKKMMMEKLKKGGVDMAENASDDEVMNAYEKMMKGDKKKNEMDDDKDELEMKKKDAKGNSSDKAPAWFQSFEERFSSLESAVNSSKDQEKAPYIEAAKNCGISEADAKAMSIDSLRAVVANSGESVNFTGGTGEYAANSKPFSLDI